MATKTHRVQPRIDQSTYVIFKKLAKHEGLNMSKLARRLIDAYIQQKTSV